MTQRKDVGQGSSGIGLEGYYTSELQAEFSCRLGVETVWSNDPHDRIVVLINGRAVIDRSGPAAISVNID